MTDDVSETMDCPVCGGDGFMACDDGSEVQCDRCNGTGQVPIEGDASSMAEHARRGQRPTAALVVPRC
jgi:DnaJ-class molecular chaperone